jgi:uncharacterized protein (UPF0332 family)
VPVCANDLLVAAYDIKNKCNATEADFRSSISRAYYACYHGAVEFHSNLAKPGITKEKCGVHENLQHMLNHPNVPKTDDNHSKSLLIAHFLKGQLFNRRNVDYDLQMEITDKHVNVVFANTDKIFQNI